MPTLSNMPYGVTGAFESVRLNHGFADLQLWIGTDQYTFFKSKTVDLSIGARIVLPVAGIAADAGGLGGSRSIKSVSHNRDEVLVEPLSEPRYPEANIQTGRRLEKFLADSIMFTGVTHTFSVQGRGACPFTPEQQGIEVGQKTFNLAWGAGFDITTPASTILRTISQDKGKGDVWNWTAELWAWVANAPANVQTHLLSPPADVTALILPNHVCKYASSISMSEGPTRPQSNWTVTMYPTT